jgi:hypothetical protein
MEGQALTGSRLPNQFHDAGPLPHMREAWPANFPVEKIAAREIRG